MGEGPGCPARSTTSNHVFINNHLQDIGPSANDEVTLCNILFQLKKTRSTLGSLSDILYDTETTTEEERKKKMGGCNLLATGWRRLWCVCVEMGATHDRPWQRRHQETTAKDGQATRKALIQ